MNKLLITFEQVPYSETIKDIAISCGTSIEEDEDANFSGGVDFSLVANAICALAAVTQILLQITSMKTERVTLVLPDGSVLRNITLEYAKQIIENLSKENNESNTK